MLLGDPHLQCVHASVLIILFYNTVLIIGRGEGMNMHLQSETCSSCCHSVPLRGQYHCSCHVPPLRHHLCTLPPRFASSASISNSPPMKWAMRRSGGK